MMDCFKVNQLEASASLGTGLRTASSDRGRNQAEFVPEKKEAQN